MCSLLELFAFSCDPATTHSYGYCGVQVFRRKLGRSYEDVDRGGAQNGFSHNTDYY